MQYSCHEFGILEFQQLASCNAPFPFPQAARWRVGGEKEGEGAGGNGCLHLFGTSVAVSMVMGVKIVGMSQRPVQCVERCWLPDVSWMSRTRVSPPEPVGDINAGRQTDAATAVGGRCFVYPSVWMREDGPAAPGTCFITLHDKEQLRHHLTANWDTENYRSSHCTLVPNPNLLSNQ